MIGGPVKNDSSSAVSLYKVIHGEELNTYFTAIMVNQNSYKSLVWSYPIKGCEDTKRVTLTDKYMIAICPR